ncbi:ABC transporter permease [Chelativorans intermedius]|uniref:ABC transporter permease n=1 Tax=Chelativorans intermedius TaxID=515947 RepID=A0ABV6D2D6_9HYPH|nr:ABC transporter permease [Chelativorans intermedius]MCT8997398.1 ABC transporter permease [Chelativorans intermedius]
MTSSSLLRSFIYLYLVLFFAYLFLPLVFMMAAAFNDSRFPTMLPWQGFTLRWFQELFADQLMGRAVWNSILIGLGVVALSVPIGLAGALVLYNLQSRARTLIYGIMVSPILTPGVIIGISTLIFWRQYFGVGGGLMLAVVAQTTFIAAFAMLLILARLQRFDRTLEEAALDLGASHTWTFWRITVPFLRPALLAAALMAFLQSFENYNTTLFVIGTETTMTLNIASRVRLGLTPAVNAIAVILIALTILGAIIYELMRRAEVRRRALAAEAAA